MTTARSGPTATLITGSGTSLDGKVLIVGGSTGSSFLAPVDAAAGIGRSHSDRWRLNTAELYNPAPTPSPRPDSIPGCAAGTAPPHAPPAFPRLAPGPKSPITSASESGTTVTVTSAANPTGLIVGDNVTISGRDRYGIQRNLRCNRNSRRAPRSNTRPRSGLAAGTGGSAAADTAAVRLGRFRAPRLILTTAARCWWRAAT